MALLISLGLSQPVRREGAFLLAVLPTGKPVFLIYFSILVDSVPMLVVLLLLELLAVVAVLAVVVVLLGLATGWTAWTFYQRCFYCDW